MDMTVTGVIVQEKNKERCNLFIDGEFKTGLSIAPAVKFGFKKGKILNEKILNDIISDDAITDAQVKAVGYISGASKTAKQVANYLAKKGYMEEQIVLVVNHLKDSGLINDMAYAKNFIETVGDKQGRRLIEFKLLKKGIKKEDIESAFGNINFNPQEGIKQVLVKYMKNKDKSRENKSKAYRYLMGRGYLFDEIESAISEFFGE